MHCTICGGSELEDRAVLWPALIAEWELGADEVSYVDIQQGRTCLSCGGNLRTMVLSKALLTALHTEGPLTEFVERPKARSLRILDLNAAAGMGPVLATLPAYELASYPQEDMQSLSYPDFSFDVVLHSDTLEHVPDPVAGLHECRRVLREGGLLVYTVPIIVGRMTRRRDGLTPSYHGDPNVGSDDFRVHTEYGADAWCQVLQAGFDSVTLTTLNFPAAQAVSAKRPADHKRGLL